MPAANTSRHTRKRWTLQVVAKHISLYVNDYTLALDEAAVHVMLEWQRSWDSDRLAGLRQSSSDVQSLNCLLFTSITFYFRLQLSTYRRLRRAHTRSGRA